ncbi:MAG: hypothetical protein LC803_09490 [Acidobacteria bacterium]|nr:hypothetical protein [Acidobacteriota bacterium]
MSEQDPPKANVEDERNLESLAMNIVFQIGDALYEALPPDVAHEHFVAARQKTNDIAIDFAKKLIAADRRKAVEGATSNALDLLEEIGATAESIHKNLAEWGTSIGPKGNDSITDFMRSCSPEHFYRQRGEKR